MMTYQHYFTIDKNTLICKIWKYYRYRDDVLCREFSLNHIDKDKLNSAFEKWFFANSRYRTSEGIALCQFKDLPNKHNIWRDMHHLQIAENLWLSAPNMYEFLILKPGGKVSLDGQLECIFCV